ncbi:DUF4157 domain-containing protein [Saccharopolyspora dendranthemae]|uniref:Uncharacterized protein DUF4157 n=1 Tax=Saccharopolyspora dendranthemae TaxID=1181886 RepID=A0A561U846_9PSEU|nr:DUF4157 domain-containing protein [Saccharopolyspora dendranthemae]TWF95521.1 uncharacterized protein DUF4157 [Saccharopolyspora dendranthemae]
MKGLLGHDHMAIGDDVRLNDHDCRPERPHQRSQVADDRESDRATAAAALRGSPLTPASIRSLQRAAGNAAVNSMFGEQAQAAEVQRSTVHDVLRSSGRPLDPPVRTEMESRLGDDFSDVRVHTDGAAHTAAESVQAHAFTSGSHIVFQKGRYDTSSTSGKHMLAHELTHVAQQRSGPVAGTSTSDGLKVSDPSDSFERAAEANADRAMAEPVQRHREDAAQDADRKPTPGDTFVQRDVGFEIEVGPRTFAMTPPLEKVTENPGVGNLRNAIATTGGLNGSEADWHDLNQDPRVRARRLAKQESLVTVPGLFNVEADDASSGGSNLEFVTVPFPESRKGRRQLIKALDRIKRVADQLDGRMLTADNLARAARGNALTPTPPSGDTRAEFIADGQVRDGNPQATVGVPLKNLSVLFAAAEIDKENYNTDVKDLSEKDLTGGQLIATAQRNVDRVLKEQPENQPKSDELRGLLRLIAAYLRGGAHSPTRPYFKMIAPMMGRTDFAAMFKLLGDSEREQLAANDGRLFVDLALRCADPDSPYPAGEPVLQRAGSPPSPPVAFPELTRDVWLRHITKGTDVLTQHGYPEIFPQNSLKAKEFESMGSLKDKTDFTKDRIEAPVVELRRMRQSLPVDEWKPVLLGVFDLIIQINKKKRRWHVGKKNEKQTPTYRRAQ